MNHFRPQHPKSWNPHTCIVRNFKFYREINAGFSINLDGKQGKRVLLQLRINVWNPGSCFPAWGNESNQLLLLWGVQCSNPTAAMLTLNFLNKENPHNLIFPLLSTIILAKYKAKFYKCDWSNTNRITIGLYRQVWLDLCIFDGSYPSFDWLKIL